VAERMSAPAQVQPDSFQAEATSEADSLAVRADFMARDKHYGEAQAMAEAALKSDPKLALAHETMGFILSQQGKMEEATKWYGEAVALNSQSCMANYYYAVNLFRGKLDDDTAAKAESSLRSAIKVAPDFAPAYSALGWLLAVRHNNLQEAYLMATTAVGLEPGEVHYRINAAQVFEMMGQFDNALRVAKIAASMAKTVEEESQALNVISRVQQRQEFEERRQTRLEAIQKAQADAAAAGMLRPPEAEPGPASPPDREGDSGQPPVLRHRNEAPDGNGPAVPVHVLSSAHSPRPELLPIRQVAEGTIEDVKCSGASTLEMTLASSSGVIHLYSDDYLKIPYSALNFQPKGILNPCTDVKGWHARVTYHPSKNQAKQGEMLVVGLFKN
jgi:tetratricopeptide (TPR) repeat protein